MKTLLLIRHAKSDWRTGLTDHDRPLNGRGIKNAPEMAQRIVNRVIAPQLLVSSSAVRAQSTAQAMQSVFTASNASRTPELITNPKLYACTARAWFDVIHTLPDELNCVAIYGHDPAISSVASELTQRPTHMVTCAVAQCVFDIKHWSDVSAQTLSDHLIDTPKVPYSP